MRLLLIVVLLSFMSPLSNYTYEYPKQTENQLTKTIERDIDCLAKNIYHESRGEPTKGQYAVAHVTMNRVSQYGLSVCRVVYQPSQFSWTIGKTPAVYDKVAFDKAKEIAWDVYRGDTHDFTGGATYYHAKYVKPNWSRKFKKTLALGSHIFYKVA